MTDSRRRAAAAVRAVQVIPSGLVITRLLPSSATATRTPLPKTTERHEFASEAERAVFVSPAAACPTPGTNSEPNARATAIAKNRKRP